MRRLSPALLMLLLFGCRSASGPGEEAGKFLLSAALKDQRTVAQRATRFLEEIQAGKHASDPKKFDFTSHDLSRVREEMKRARPVPVELYRPWWPWSKAVAYYDQFGIKLNMYTLERPDCQVINTLVHEWFHSLGYGHGSNYANGKDNSVPYFMGSLAEALCSEGKI